MKTVSLVGSTGSIGTQAVDVIRAEPDRYRVIALGACSSVDRLAAQAAELHPERVAIAEPSLAGNLARRVPIEPELLPPLKAMHRECRGPVLAMPSTGMLWRKVRHYLA